MTRRTLDLILATGGVAACVLVLILGFVLQNQAGFAKDTMKQQLRDQQITFTAANKLSDQEKTWKSGSSCLVANAGKILETGAQAECYADYYIALHLEEAAKAAGYPGATYATIGATQTDLRNKVADAQKNNDPQLSTLQKQLDSVNGLRNTQFQGETLRGMLLSAYGFSIFGERIALMAVLSFALAAVIGVLALAGYGHAVRTPKTQLVLGSAGVSAH